MFEEVEQFYKEIAAEYDAMTRFSVRLQKEHPVLEQWIKKYPSKKILDAACGSGLHALILAQLGMDVTGADISRDMLKLARQNARQLNASVKWVKTSLQQLKPVLNEQFDTIFCLGNSLPHLITERELDAAFRNFYELLNDQGRVVIQLLNYSKILSDRERMVGIRRTGNSEFVRFYDFVDDKCIRFNILTIRWNDDVPSYQLSSTTLYPYQKEHLNNSLKHQGFRNQEFYGDMEFAPFDVQQSPNLIIVAQKS